MKNSKLKQAGLTPDGTAPEQTGNKREKPGAIGAQPVHKERHWSSAELNVQLHQTIRQNGTAQPATADDFAKLIATLTPAPS